MKSLLEEALEENFRVPEGLAYLPLEEESPPDFANFDEDIQDLARELYNLGHLPKSGRGRREEAPPFIILEVPFSERLSAEVDNLHRVLEKRSPGRWRLSGKYPPGGPAVILMMEA